MKLQIFFCWSVVLIDSVLKKDVTYYPEVFLKGCKCTEKEKRGD